MKYKIIGVLDRLIRRYMPLQLVSDLPDDDIVESHRRAVLTKKIPEDLAANYELFRFGDFDDVTGKVTLEATPVFLASLAEFIPVKKEVKENVSKGQPNA